MIQTLRDFAGWLEARGGMAPCGCEYHMVGSQIHGAPVQAPSGTLVYCPLHASAARMLMVLDAIEKNWSRDQYHDVPLALIDSARAALRSARGETTFDGEG